MATTGVIILAAGQSSRLGKPKQNLIYSGKTLLQHALSAAIYPKCGPVIVVLGANAEDIQPQIESSAVKIVYNANWHTGMASSIRTGVTELQKNVDVDSGIIMLCDQPYVNSELLVTMLRQYKTSQRGIIACAYNNTYGVPVLFNEKYFSHLLSLNGHEGAKKILTTHAVDIEPILFSQGSIDIDTMKDYNDLLK